MTRPTKYRKRGQKLIRLHALVTPATYDALCAISRQKNCSLGAAVDEVVKTQESGCMRCTCL